MLFGPASSTGSWKTWALLWVLSLSLWMARGTLSPRREACLWDLSQKSWLSLFLAVLVDFFFPTPVRAELRAGLFCRCQQRGRCVRLCVRAAGGVCQQSEVCLKLLAVLHNLSRRPPSAPTSAAGFVALLYILSSSFKKTTSLFLSVVVQKQYLLLLEVTAA